MRADSKIFCRILRLCKNRPNSFWTVFPGALTASVGYWATLSLNIPDFTRYAKSQKSQMLGASVRFAADDDGVLRLSAWR